MGTKTRVSAAVLVAAACVYFVTRTPQAESPRMATVEPPTADVELVGAAVLSAAEDPAMEAVRRSPVAEKPPVGVPTVAGTKVLRVVLDGITEENARMTRVTLTGVDERDEWPAEIRDSWPCQGLTSEFDLDPFFASVAERDGDLRVDELEVQVDHPLYVLETTRVPLSSGVELESGRTVYEAQVRLVPAAVMHGHLVRENGDPASEGLVGALLLEGGFPEEDIAGTVDCAADGAFELRVRASGTYALASHEEGRRPTTTRVEALVGTRIDVGTIVLESGHTIAGHVLRQGKPVTGATVSLTSRTVLYYADPADVEKGMNPLINARRTLATKARSVRLVWVESQFELLRQGASVDENGAFAFGGLGPVEYLLRMGELAEAHASVGGGWEDTGREEMVRINGGKPALAVRAPQHGVVLEFTWTLIRFELAGDLESEDKGRLQLRTKTANPTDLSLLPKPLPKNISIMPEFYSGEFQLSGDVPVFVLQAPPNKHMTGEVLFPGWQPVPFEFSTPDTGGEVVVPIRLLSVEELATLVIALENPQAEILETFSVLLTRAGQGDFPPDHRLVQIADGQLRVEGILPGKYRVGVRPGDHPNYPTGLFFEYGLDLEFHPGREVTRSIMLQQCAGLRLTVRDEDGALVGGEFDFLNDLGGRAHLTLEVGEGHRQGYSYLQFYPYGTHESVNPLHPGRYRLVLVSPGLAKRSVTVELRAGEYEEVDVTLSQ